MKPHVAFAAVVMALVGVVASARQTNPCDADLTGPFTITSGRPFTVQWCTSVSDKIDGHSMKLDAGAKIDVQPLDLGISSVTSRHAWQFTWSSGVAKGSHTMAVSSWNLASDGTRQDGPATVVPFTAADPVVVSPPSAPTGLRVIR